MDPALGPQGSLIRLAPPFDLGLVSVAPTLSPVVQHSPPQSSPSAPFGSKSPL